MECFIAGTPIQMADGTTKAIEQVKVGDSVLSLNPQTGKAEAKQVTQTFTNVVDHVREIRLGEESLFTTDDHPFLTERGFVSAKALGIGTTLITRAGPPGSVPSSSLGKASVRLNAVELRPSALFGYTESSLGANGGNSSGFKVYNFEVEGNHSYFVGNTNGGVAVHNDCLTHQQIDMLVREAGEKAMRERDFLDSGDDVERAFNKAIDAINERLKSERSDYRVLLQLGRRPSGLLVKKTGDRFKDAVLGTLWADAALVRMSDRRVGYVYDISLRDFGPETMSTKPFIDKYRVFGGSKMRLRDIRKDGTYFAPGQKF
jgi:hypothetical protein